MQTHLLTLIPKSRDAIASKNAKLTFRHHHLKANFFLHSNGEWRSVEKNFFYFLPSTMCLIFLGAKIGQSPNLSMSTPVDSKVCWQNLQTFLIWTPSSGWGWISSPNLQVSKMSGWNLCFWWGQIQSIIFVLMWEKLWWSQIWRRLLAVKLL